MIIRSAKELDVYRETYEPAMMIFRASQKFPPEERYALVSQIRRSSRSVTLNLREAWAKRRYAAHFDSKLTDSDGENSETDSSLDYARDCGYITENEHSELAGRCARIGKMLVSMIRNPRPFIKTPVGDSPRRRPTASDL